MPFESQGLDIFVKTITQTHDVKQWELSIQKRLLMVKRGLFWIFWGTLGVIVVFYIYCFVISVF